MDQPAEPKYKIGLVECYNKNHAMGGSDKLTNKHRFDPILIANGIIRNRTSCQFIEYHHDEHDDSMEIAKQFEDVGAMGEAQIRAFWRQTTPGSPWPFTWESLRARRSPGSAREAQEILARDLAGASRWSAFRSASRRACRRPPAATCWNASLRCLAGRRRSGTGSAG